MLPFINSTNKHTSWHEASCIRFCQMQTTRFKVKPGGAEAKTNMTGMFSWCSSDESCWFIIRFCIESLRDRAQRLEQQICRHTSGISNQCVENQLLPAWNIIQTNTDLHQHCCGNEVERQSHFNKFLSIKYKQKNKTKKHVLFLKSNCCLSLHN